MVPLYLDHPGSWAICPISVARSFQQTGAPMVSLELTEVIPQRTCYMLSSRTQSKTEPTAAAIFRDGLRGFLSHAHWLDIL